MTKISRVETAKFVCDYAKELAQLAKKAGLHNLAYLLEVAAIEAEAQSATLKAGATAR